jgi:hypothetical protein
MRNFLPINSVVTSSAWVAGIWRKKGGRCIQFLNTATSAPLSCYNTGSLVYNLVWLKNVNELVSTEPDHCVEVPDNVEACNIDRTHYVVVFGNISRHADDHDGSWR